MWLRAACLVWVPAPGQKRGLNARRRRTRFQLSHVSRRDDIQVDAASHVIGVAGVMDDLRSFLPVLPFFYDDGQYQDPYAAVFFSRFCSDIVVRSFTVTCHLPFAARARAQHARCCCSALLYLLRARRRSLGLRRGPGFVRKNRFCCS